MPARILIADDSPLFRKTLRHTLEVADQWEIIETRDGAEAVSKTLELRPDLIILDLAMPVKDGFSAAREISQSLPGTPVLLCTMHDSPQLHMEAKKAGVWKILSKSESAGIVLAVRQLLTMKPPPGQTGLPAANAIPPPVVPADKSDVARAANPAASSGPLPGPDPENAV